LALPSVITIPPLFLLIQPQKRDIFTADLVFVSFPSLLWLHTFLLFSDIAAAVLLLLFSLWAWRGVILLG
jgi:hypothetical protein